VYLVHLRRGRVWDNVRYGLPMILRNWELDQVVRRLRLGGGKGMSRIDGRFWGRGCGRREGFVGMREWEG